MPWKTIDFHGVANLDRSLLDQLKLHLDEKESLIGYSILHLIKDYTEGEHPSHSTRIPLGHVRLAEALDACSRRIREMKSEKEFHFSFEQWRSAVIGKVNGLLWDYVETLEGCVTELFQQLGQVPLEEWDGELFQVVGEIKILLIQHIDEASWSVKRLDALFWDCRWTLEKNKGSFYLLLKKMLCNWKMLLDRALLTDLDKSRKFFSFHYKKFSARYREYLKLKIRSEQSARKFSHYHVLSLIEVENQNFFKNSYQQLKIWMLNQSYKALPKDLITRTLQSSISFRKLSNCFNEYHKMLKRILFERSRILKRDAHEQFLTPENIAHQQKLIEGYRAEVHTLWSTISRYREFLLSTDPDPYIRSRWGFSEWTVGPEPAQTRQLLDLEYELECLDHMFESVGEALAKGTEHQVEVREIKSEMSTILHEMSQPLISRNMMRVNAEKLLENLLELNELGTFEQATVDFVGDVLTKALRVDWKYHVFFDIPLFDQVYNTHQGIVGEPAHRQHLNRTNQFRELVDQLHSWVKTRTLNKHTHEIEQDLNDIKEGLQDFFAYVQRSLSDQDLSKDEAVDKMNEIGQVLLEYRYLFSKFFHELKDHEPQERIIRNQFLFVDQYFDSIDSKIYEFKKSLFM